MTKDLFDLSGIDEPLRRIQRQSSDLSREKKETPLWGNGDRIVRLDKVIKYMEQNGEFEITPKEACKIMKNSSECASVMLATSLRFKRTHRGVYELLDETNKDTMRPQTPAPEEPTTAPKEEMPKAEEIETEIKGIETTNETVEEPQEVTHELIVIKKYLCPYCGKEVTIGKDV